MARRRTHRGAKRSLRRTRRTKGGAIIAKGSSGCIFSPEVACAGKSPREGFISKFMASAEAEGEVRHGETVHALDPTYRYFVYAIDPVCEKSPSASNFGGKRCEVDTRWRGELDSIISMPNGGMDLSHVLKTLGERPSHADKISLFQSFGNLFEGLSLLHKNGLMHRDIKDTNMVAIKKEGGFHARLIDFGQTTNAKDIVIDEKGYYLNNFWWPFEFRFFSEDGFKEPDAEIKQFYKSLLKEGSKGRGDTDVTYQEEFPLLWMYKTIAGNLITEKWAREVYSTIRAKTVPEQVEILLRSEIYSLGVTLYVTYERVFGHKCIGSGRITLPEDTAEQRTLRDTISRPFFALIEKMCKPNTFERISLREAHEEYQHIFSERRIASAAAGVAAGVAAEENEPAHVPLSRHTGSISYGSPGSDPGSPSVGSPSFTLIADESPVGRAARSAKAMFAQGTSTSIGGVRLRVSRRRRNRF